MQLFSKNEPMTIEEIATAKHLSKNRVRKLLESAETKFARGIARLRFDPEVRELASASFRCDDEEL